MENNPVYTQQSSDQPYPKKSLPIRYIVIIEVVLVVLVLGILFSVLSYFNIISPSLFLPKSIISSIQPSDKTNAAPVSVGPNSAIDVKNKLVYSAVTYYYLRDLTIQKIDEGGIKLSVYSPADLALKIPDLSISNDTVITIGQKDGPGVAATLLSLKQGDQVNIAVAHNLKTSEWVANNIYVLDLSQVATSSAQ